MSPFKNLFLLLLTLFSCRQPSFKESSPTAGEIRIQCDEALSNIISQEKDIFERNYPYAKINLNYVSELELFRNFINDTTEVIIASRTLNAEEKTFLAQVKNLHPREFPFAVSALALVSSYQNEDSTMNYEELIQALQGEGAKKNLSFVIENTQSGIPAFLMQLAKVEKLPSNFYAQNNTEELIQYVMNHREAIGVLDWSRISDSDDPYSKSTLSKVRLMGIRQAKDSLKEEFVRPYQYNLQDNKYPLTKELVFISRTGKNDLGLGFASFITGEIGQRILLKAGLLPLYQTDRWIELKTTGNQTVVR